MAATARGCESTAIHPATRAQETNARDALSGNARQIEYDVWAKHTATDTIMMRQTPTEANI